MLTSPSTPEGANATVSAAPPQPAQLPPQPSRAPSGYLNEPTEDVLELKDNPQDAQAPPRESSSVFSPHSPTRDAQEANEEKALFPIAFPSSSLPPLPTEEEKQQQREQPQQQIPKESTATGKECFGVAAAGPHLTTLPHLRSQDDCESYMLAHALQKEAELHDHWLDDLEVLTDSPGNDRQADEKGKQNKSKHDDRGDKNSKVDEGRDDGADGGAAGQPQRATLRGFFSRHNLQVASVPFVCGMINGYTIGYVAPYTQLYKMSTNCALYTAQKGCEAVPFADCVWRTAATTTTTLSDGAAQSVSYCGWPTITCRAAYPNDAWMGGGGNTTLAEQQCLQDSRCTWSYSAKECQNPSGYSASYTGLFAGSIIAGSMFGAILGGPLVTNLGTRLTFVLSGILSVVCSVMGHIDAATDEFWVLVVERFVIGFFMGLITVACPLYVNTNAAPLYRRKLGTLFQVFTTFGVFLAGTIGLGVGQSVPYHANRDADISGRMQGLASGQTALSLAMIFLGLFSSESKVKYGKKAGGLNQNEYSYRDMIGPLLMSIVLNGTMRLTGFNAILNFAPTIMGGLGLAPLVGNTIMTICNFVGTLVSIPLDSFFSIRSIFLFGSCFISCMCLFLCGVPVYPGVASESATNGCAITGIVVFIFSFEVFVGPSFYVLCQEIFPPSFRPRGNSFAQLWQFIINLVINVCYPIAAERFSGGPSGNQHKGQSIIFIFFGGVGLVCFAIEFFFLKLWDEERAKPCCGALLKVQAEGEEGETHEMQGDASGTTSAEAAMREAEEAGNKLGKEGGAAPKNCEDPA